jgi:hypothetical protein
MLRCWPGESFPKKVWFPQKLPHYPKLLKRKILQKHQFFKIEVTK